LDVLSDAVGEVEAEDESLPLNECDAVVVKDSE
jgi:hypothetical protein